MFKEGHFELQDASSQTIAPFLEVKPGMRVVDACAGAGGKALHLAALMENKGQIIAMDIYQNKLYELKRRAKRNGAHNIETRWIENSKAIKKLHGKIDRLLIDAPCSGLGVLKRNPDAKWKLQSEFLATIQKTQADILERYAKMVAPQGKMVYATCSILPSENQKQIKRFLETDIGKTFELEAEDTLLPSKTGFDGFYRARLMRK
jgi:16S rRNA (cytosine967-C5)-methyltransferase